jgi:preprotein translocase subunit SecG
MTTFLIIIHILASLVLIAVVLLQSGKGAEMGVSFGATYSQTIFGSRGAGSFLSKVTIAVAAVFMVSALAIAALTQRGASSSVIIPPSKGAQVPMPTAPPATPTAPAAPQNVTPAPSPDTSGGQAP